MASRDRLRYTEAAARGIAPDSGSQANRRLNRRARGNGHRSSPVSGLQDQTGRGRADVGVHLAGPAARIAWTFLEHTWYRLAVRLTAGIHGESRPHDATNIAGGVSVDFRLVPAALGSWAAAWIGTRVGPGLASAAGVAGLALGTVLGIAANAAATAAPAPGGGLGPANGASANWRRRGGPPAGGRSRDGPCADRWRHGAPVGGRSKDGVPGRKARGRAKDRWSAGSAVALTLLCLGAVLLAAGVQGDTRTRGPIRAVIAESGTVTATLLIRGEPRHAAPGPSAFGTGTRLLLDAVVTEATARGKRFRADTPVVLLGGVAWAKVRTGDHVATAGKLVPGLPGQEAAALFLTAGGPRVLPLNPGWLQWTGGLKSRWRLACGWLWPDAAGLLPGMTVGDRTSIPADLDTAMKRVGLTHLTAVSGANCTLILGGLLFVARCLRMPRWPAAAAAAAGLWAFVALVGPDPSVLRAALMGLIGLLAMLSGRPRRILALLAVTVVVLLALDPWLSGSFAFILSVLATLGLVLLGRPCAQWLGAWLPHWLAQTVAVPLSAQLFCAPVIVLLQPQLTLYSLPANIAVALVVALVTVIGTLGLPALVLMPGVAPAFVAVSGLGAEWVALAAKFFSGLPGAAFPWPGGAVGVALMAILSAITVAMLWSLVNHRRFVGMAIAVRARLPARWGAVTHLPFVTAVAAAAAGLATWVLGESGML